MGRGLHAPVPAQGGMAVRDISSVQFKYLPLKQACFHLCVLAPDCSDTGKISCPRLPRRHPHLWFLLSGTLTLTGTILVIRGLCLLKRSYSSLTMLSWTFTATPSVKNLLTQAEEEAGVVKFLPCKRADSSSTSISHTWVLTQEHTNAHKSATNTHALPAFYGSSGF